LHQRRGAVPRRVQPGKRRSVRGDVRPVRARRGREARHHSRRGAARARVQARSFRCLRGARIGGSVMPDGAPLLSARALTKRYGAVTALDGVSFDIHDGITGILGENGAGKSTAIKIFLGLVKPTSGEAGVL